jgi:hypothetical protein
VDSVLGWYSRSLRTSPRERAQSGAVVAVQRASSDSKLNPRLHVVFLDGVYAATSDGSLEFRAPPRLSTTDVADVLQIARARILRYLERRGVIQIDTDADVLHAADDLAERDPALAQLAAAAVSGLAPAGPELRRRPVERVIEGRPGVVITAPLSVREAGFSLHAATRGRHEKGLCRLAAIVPAPRFHMVRYSGVLGPASKWRPLIVPKPLPEAPGDAASAAAPDSCGPPPACDTTGSRYRPWAELLMRTFGIDVETCPGCGGRMRLLALITEPPNVARFLRHLGEATEPPPRAPARAPPFTQSRVLRRRHDEHSAQRELFEEH